MFIRRGMDKRSVPRHMNAMSLIKKTLLGQANENGPKPVWLMRQAGRYLPEYREVRAKAGGFVDLCLNPDLATEVTLQPIRRYGFDAAILFSDILMVPHGLGQKLWFQEGEGPRLTPITDNASLAVAGLLERLAPIFSTVRQVRAALPAQTELIGFAGSPWTVASYMIEGGGGGDFHAIRKMAFAAPEKLDDIIDTLVEATLFYTRAQIEAGAGVIQLFDSWAGNVGHPLFDRYIIGPTRKIVEGLKHSHPEVPIIGFPRLAGSNLPRYVAETGVHGVGLDTGVSLPWAVATVPPTVTLQGNIDPLALVAGGKALDAAADHVLQQAKGRRFIINLGHGIIPATPPEHVAQLVARVREGQG